MVHLIILVQKALFAYTAHTTLVLQPINLNIQTNIQTFPSTSYTLIQSALNYLTQIGSNFWVCKLKTSSRD